MEAVFCEIGLLDEKELKFAVVSANYKGKWIFVRHKLRSTWEIPGGHREGSEAISQTAARELFEETGVKAANIIPICEYGVNKDNETSFGRLFYAEVIEFAELPDFEIGEVKLFDNLPMELTYPQIQPKLFERTLRFISRN